ncbi:MAG: S-layer homology domain-containing protein [Candidatus Ornithomonoglobus sp.]
MSKKFKSLICTLLAGMMLATSTGIAALAEDTAETAADAGSAEVVAEEMAETAEDAEAAEAAAEEGDAEVPEEAADDAEAEAPAEEETPTEAPAANDYDNDTYYQNALKVVSALGIITGYEDGSIKPESTVTRAEMATIVLRMLAQTANSTYQNVFTDLEASHWAADTIQTAVEQGILDGMGDGTFVPDGNVKYEQVLKMIVCAMNYGTDAENAGGYPQGYVAVGGTTLKLLTGVKGATGTDMPRGEVIKTVYNALLASYREITDFKNGLPVYTATDTLGVALFDMYEDEGVLTTTPNITIATGSVAKEGVVTIDGIDYKCDMNVDEYVGTKIKFYYIDDKADDPKIIALFSMGKSTEYTFNADDIDSIDTTAGSIKVFKSETTTSTTSYKINNATVIYNGTILSTADYAKYIGGDDYDGFITPHVGTVKIVDYDSDGVYDILFVESYETMLVTTATTEKLTGKINNVSTTITYDLDDNDYTVTVTKSGSAATVKNLKKNDVASIKRNIESTTIDITVTGETITGEITSVGEDDGDTTITLNGQTYKVDENAVADIRTGLSGNFYLDMFDRVGYISTDGALTSNEKYAMITKAYYNDESELVIRLYTQDGSEIEVKPSSSLNYWAPGAKAAVSKPSEDTLYKTLNSDSAYIQCNGNPVRLCKYSLNSSGDLTKLYVAVSSTATDDTDALTMYASNLANVASVGGTLSGYTINDGIVEFSVPNDVDSDGNLTGTDRFSGSNYSVGTVTASAYKNYDGGVNIDFVIGGFTAGSAKTAQILVKFVTSATALYGINELDTASIMPAMIVSKINEAVDADGDTIFQIKGYSGGTEVSYMTMDTTGVYKFTGWNDREYGGELLFDATSDDTSDFMDVIKPGDIITMATSGTNIKAIARLVSVDDVAEMAIKGSITDTTTAIASLPYAASAVGSYSREYYYMGFVSSVDIEDSAFIGLSDVNKSSEAGVTYDTGSVFSYATITVNSSGKITNTTVDKSGGLEPAELEPLGDDPYEFDFGVFTSLKGNMNNGYVIRVVLDID